MKIHTLYKSRIRQNSKAFDDTARLYCRAVDFYINVCLNEWNDASKCSNSKDAVNFCENISLRTKSRPVTKYDFSGYLYKFPCYLRRAAIAAAFGKVSSYKSNLANWNANPVGRKPGIPHTGRDFPFMYRKNMFNMTDLWSWLPIPDEVMLKEHTCFLSIYIGNILKYCRYILKPGLVNAIFFI